MKQTIQFGVPTCYIKPPIEPLTPPGLDAPPVQQWPHLRDGLHAPGKTSLVIIAHVFGKTAPIDTHSLSDEIMQCLNSFFELIL